VVKDGSTESDKIAMRRIQDIKNAPSIGAYIFSSRKLRRWVVWGRSVLLNEFMTREESSRHSVTMRIHVWSDESIRKAE